MKKLFYKKHFVEINFLFTFATKINITKKLHYENNIKNK